MIFNSEIPYSAYWSTPFTKWQGSLSSFNSIELAAWVAKNELKSRNIDPNLIDYGVLGTSIPQKHSFFGLPWLTGLIGIGNIGGPTISQACATGTRILLNAAQEIDSGLANCALVIAADRCSNGPHLYFPNPKGSGGTGTHENWVLDNFSFDPLGKHSMLDTAENIAKEAFISREQQHDVLLRRQEQYEMATNKNNAFQKRYMTLPFDVPSPNYQATVSLIKGDEGVIRSNVEALTKLQPIKQDGTVTFGGQTHPADGNAGLIIASPDKAIMMSSDSKIRIRILGFGSARVKLANMPAATVPAAQKALLNAGLQIKQMSVIKSHNPFAVNDIYFANKMGIDVNYMNNYGSSLIWGHPQAPTGLRSIIEMIEELVVLGGGYGVFTGCAAGDSAMAIVIQVDNR